MRLSRLMLCALIVIASGCGGSGQDTNLVQTVTDKNGNVTTYCYDSLNRLTSANTPGTHDNVWTRALGARRVLAVGRLLALTPAP